MPKWGMVIDLDRCTGCQACTIACRTENNIPSCGDKNAWRGRAIFWNKVLSVRMDKEGHGGTEHGPASDERRAQPRWRFVPLPCMHCDRPPCTLVCPVRATTRNVEGIVMQVPSRCIGCRLCQAACPYSRRYFNWQEVEFPGDLKQAVNPDVSIRTLGVIEKCTFCVQRYQKAREQARADNRPLREGDYVPACVEACPAKVRTFGDLENPEHTVAQLARSPRAFRLLEELGTHPKVVYLQEGAWKSEFDRAVEKSLSAPHPVASPAHRNEAPAKPSSRPASAPASSTRREDKDNSDG